MENMTVRVRYTVNAFDLKVYLNVFLMHANLSEAHGITKIYRMLVINGKLTIPGHIKKEGYVRIVARGLVDGWQLMTLAQINKLALCLQAFTEPEDTVDLEFGSDRVRVYLFI